MSDAPTIFPLHGELTLETVEDLEPKLIPLASRPGGRLVLDLGEVSVVTTPGIGLFLELHRNAREAGGRFVVARANPNIRDVIRRTQLDRIFQIAETLEDAIARASV